MSSDDDDDWMNGGPLHRGRFRKGQSGNPKGRPKRAKLADPSELEQAQATIRVGEKLIPIRDGGRSKKRKIIDVIAERLAHEALVNNDKDSMKIYLKRHDDAMRKVTAHNKAAQEKLGQYFRLVEEGKAPRLHEAEAQFLQKVADDAGYKVEIRAYKVEGVPEPVTERDLAEVATPQLKRALGVSFQLIGDAEFRTIVTKILREDRKQRFHRAAVEPVWKPSK